VNHFKHSALLKLKVLRVLSSAFVFSFIFLYSRGAQAQSPIKLPALFPPADKNNTVSIKAADGHDKKLTLDGKIQGQLQAFLAEKGNPIAAVVLIEVTSGNIIAMAQGRQPAQWGDSSTHTALYADFPAASLFKMVTTAAILEVGATSLDKVRNLNGGCADVNPQGSWLREEPSKYDRKFTLAQAFAVSCNGFFAQMAVKYLGLNVLSLYANKFGWDGGINADFYLQASPHVPPLPTASSVGMVGKYAAGFGRVGISPVHAAWINLAIAHKGMSMPIHIFADSTKANAPGNLVERRLLSEDNSAQLREIMHNTVITGAARGAFRPKKYRLVRELAGGKTGSLTGKAPKGYTTWFSGMLPYKNPQVVVSAVVVNDQHWQIRGSQLAAEALWLWYQEFYSSKS
jgi:cell division protein FtsI/penicillin-binding protein 2